MEVTSPGISKELTVVSSKLLRGTNTVWSDEPCFQAGETNRVLPIAGAGLRRIQRIIVIRNDEQVEFLRDLGPAENFTAEQVGVIGHVDLGGGHYEVLETVERVLAALDDWRASGKEAVGEREEPPDFVKGYEELAIRRHDAVVGRKRFAITGLRGAA